MNEKSSELMYKLMGDYDISKHPVLWEKEQAVREHITELEAELEALKKQVRDLINAGDLLAEIVFDTHWFDGEEDTRHWYHLSDKIKKETK